MFLLLLIVQWVRQVTSHLVIKNELYGFFLGGVGGEDCRGKRGEEYVIGWEAVKNNADSCVLQ